MKRLLFIGALSGAGAHAAHSQTIEAMTEQLIELKLFERNTLNSYQLMSDGLDSIGQTTDDVYLLHVNYFSSLDELNPNLGVDPSTIKKLNDLVLQIKQLLYEQTNNSTQPVKHS
jgi:hypothetical protein